ncbi:MAG: hypothetical protein JWN27_3314, partial [Candidatus Eremiobacteraeota bacterium]|nr:hypothetical protein [Candidatus Eremiobacteraeota bacterium]
MKSAFSQPRGAPFIGSLFAALVLLAAPAGAQSSPPPSPSPAPPLPVPPAALHPLSFRGFFRAYDFTRQNASKAIGGSGQVNQQSIELGLGLHGEYRFGHTPFSVGASYLVAEPTDGCASPIAHLSAPCGKVKAPALNPDDSLPGFALNALYEAYVQYKDPRLSVKLGDQVFNTPWTSSSDTRIKPTAFQG